MFAQVRIIMLRHAPIVLLLSFVAFGVGYVLNYFWPQPMPVNSAPRHEYARRTDAPAERPPQPAAKPPIELEIPPMPVLPSPPAIKDPAPEAVPPLIAPLLPAAPGLLDAIPAPVIPVAAPTAAEEPKVELPPLPKPDAPKIDLPPKIDFPPIADLPPAPKVQAPPPRVEIPPPPPKVEAPVAPPRFEEPAPMPPVARARTDDPMPPPAAANPALPPARMINTRDVAFKFEITRWGSSGIQAVELWLTEDDGKTWEMFIRQEGDQSPIKARLRGEGVYGFRLVLVNGNGHRVGEPKPGDAPAMRAELDLTLPRLKIDSIERSKANDGRLEIKWWAADRNLDEASMRLEWSEDGTAWNTLTPPKEALNPKAEGNYPSTLRDDPRFGQVHSYLHSWKVPEKIPTLVLMRVKTRDKAGNETEYRWPSRVAVDLIDPSGSMTNIEEQQPDKIEELERPSLGRRRAVEEKKD